jgi:hypothetical protein
MPPYSTHFDFALDVITEDCNTSTSSDLSFITKSQHSSASAVVSKQQKKAQSVCFDQYDEMVEIQHIDDFSQGQVDDTWWSPQEQNDIRMECSHLVGRLNAGEVMDPEEMLGLEKHLKAVTKRMKRVRQSVYEGVFSLQEMEEVTSSAERTIMIAEFYKNCSATSALKARLSALKFALEVDTDEVDDLSSLQ